MKTSLELLKEADEALRTENHVTREDPKTLEELVEDLRLSQEIPLKKGFGNIRTVIDAAPLGVHSATSVPVPADGYTSITKFVDLLQLAGFIESKEVREYDEHERVVDTYLSYPVMETVALIVEAAQNGAVFTKGPPVDGVYTLHTGMLEIYKAIAKST